MWRLLIYLVVLLCCDGHENASKQKRQTQRQVQFQASINSAGLANIASSLQNIAENIFSSVQQPQKGQFQFSVNSQVRPNTGFGNLNGGFGGSNGGNFEGSNGGNFGGSNGGNFGGSNGGNFGSFESNQGPPSGPPGHNHGRPPFGPPPGHSGFGPPGHQNHRPLGFGGPPPYEGNPQQGNQQGNQQCNQQGNQQSNQQGNQQGNQQSNQQGNQQGNQQPSSTGLAQTPSLLIQEEDEDKRVVAGYIEGDFPVILLTDNEIRR